MLDVSRLRKGLQVTCTDDSFDLSGHPSLRECSFPRIGQNYTVRDWEETYPGTVGIRLMEVQNPVLRYDLGGARELVFGLQRFTEAGYGPLEMDLTGLPAEDAWTAWKRILTRKLHEKGYSDADSAAFVEDMEVRLARVRAMTSEQVADILSQDPASAATIACLKADTE